MTLIKEIIEEIKINKDPVLIITAIAFVLVSIVGIVMIILTITGNIVETGNTHIIPIITPLIRTPLILPI